MLLSLSVFLFGICSNGLQTHGVEVLSLSYALRLVHALRQPQPPGTVSCHCPVLSSVSFLPVPGKGFAGNGDHASLCPLSPLPVKVRHSSLTSSSVAPSGNTFWRGAVCRFCKEGFATTWLSLQHFSQGTGVDKTVLIGELLDEEARVGAA